MTFISDRYEGALDTVRAELLSGKRDTDLLRNKDDVISDLYSRLAWAEIEPLGEPKAEKKEVERTRADFGRAVTEKVYALVIKQPIKPNRNAKEIMSLLGNSYSGSGNFDVECVGDSLTVTATADEWTEERVNSAIQHAKNQFTTETTRRNEAIKMGNKRLMDKINEIVGGRLPQIKEHQSEGQNLDDILKRRT